MSSSHGSGGKAMHQLIDAVLLPALGGPESDGADSAIIALAGNGSPRLAFTTDAYVVSPLFFPGGDIGMLAVNGTINDLAMAGARPLALSLGLILEEGLEIDAVRAIVASAAAAAERAGVRIVTGDTKVVPRGKADKMFVHTSGVGFVRDGTALSAAAIRTGDVVLVSGSIGDHGMAVMLAREALELEAPIASDTAPLHGLVERLLDQVPETRVLKDPTRGGVASTLNELARHGHRGIEISEDRVPVRGAVRGACEILGLDPLHIANEGKLIAIVPPDRVGQALAALRAHPLGTDAAAIGVATDEPAGMVIVKTAIGGARVLDMLVGDPLPRIC
ncbi:MAG TPA: hydrogenase expression/formation protein HypE [Gemmatimonadaceae bacterium]|nr:hydrogenase expression/formation protein HypE [Gemmatimonadaceae bacterium]